MPDPDARLDDPHIRKRRSAVANRQEAVPSPEGSAAADTARPDRGPEAVAEPGGDVDAGPIGTPQPRKPDATGLVALTAGVLANIQSVVGEGAAQALFRYGGFEEGKRIALASGAGRFDQALHSFDELLGHTSTGTRTIDGGIEVQLAGCGFIDEERRAVDLVLIGLYEGLLNAVFQTRYKGRILGRQSGGRVVLRFDTDPSSA